MSDNGTTLDPIVVQLDAIADGLAEFAAWHSRHPEIPLSLYCPGQWIVAEYLRDDPLTDAEIVQALKDGALVDKSVSSDQEIMFFTRQFGGGVEVSHQAKRAKVCTRRVVGTETVLLPDPSAPLVEVEQEIVEWDCAPILAGAALSGQGEQ